MRWCPWTRTLLRFSLSLPDFLQQAPGSPGAVGFVACVSGICPLPEPHTVASAPAVRTLADVEINLGVFVSCSNSQQCGRPSFVITVTNHPRVLGRFIRPHYCDSCSSRPCLSPVCHIVECLFLHVTSQGHFSREEPGCW